MHIIDQNRPKRLIVAITGASGAIYGLKLLQILKELKVETHLIVSKSANLTISAELDMSVKDIISFADYHYNVNDIAALISSGSFITDGMIIAPCSMKTLASIACGYEDNLISRSAQVILKESRKLVLIPRETPLNAIHLENMLKLSRLGVIISPAMPSFYNHPNSVDEMVEYSVARVLDLFDLSLSLNNRWKGL